MKNKISLLLLAVFAVTSSCAEKDVTPPPPPNVDPVVSPTSLSSQTITGSAEYGSTVKVKGGQAAVETAADTFTARFRVTVSLNPGASNALSVTATDAAGNESKPTMVTISQEPVKPDAISLTVTPNPVSADDGKLTATAKVSVPEKGADLSNVAITFTIAGFANISPQTVKTNAAGVATASFTGLKTSGSGGVKAAADVNGAFGTVPFDVNPGKAASVKLKLFKNAETTELADPVTLNVGDTLRTDAQALDANGNALAVPILISSDFPGALLQGKDVTNLQKAGTFTVVATAANTAVYLSRRVQVLPGAPVGLSVSFTAPEARAGDTVGIIASAVDAFGNEVPNQPIGLAVSPTLAASFTIPGTSPAQVKQQGILAGTRTFVAYDLSGVAGNTFTVTATATGVMPALVATSKLVVRPAAAFAFGCRAFSGATCTDQMLEFLPKTTLPTTTKTVSAGTDVDYLYTVVDLFGNATTGPVTVFTTAPGAVVLDDGVTGAGKITRLTVNGSYSVNFYIAGTGNKGQLALNVGTGPVGSVVLSATGTLIGPNTDVKLFARVFDAFGNVIACTPATTGDVGFTGLTSSGGPVAQKGATTCFNTAFQATYNFTREDTYSIEAEYRPGGVASGIKGAVFVTVLKFDNTPPVVSIPQAQVFRNGTPCVFSGSPLTCVVAPGDFIEFVVNANDNVSLSQISYTAFFATAGVAGTVRTRTVFIPNNAVLPINQPFSFTVPGGAFLEDVPLTALAVDGAGNIATSPQLLLRLTVQTFKGRTPALVLRNFGGVGTVNAPADVSVAPNGDLFVANAGNSNVLRLPAGAAFPQIYAGAGTFGGGFRPGFMQLDSAGNLYFSNQLGGPVIARLDTGAPPTSIAYVAYTNGGANVRGLAPSPATVAKGLINFPFVPVSGDSVTVGAVSYRFSFPTPAGCVSPTVCVNFTTPPTALQAATALRDCISAPALPTCSNGAAGPVAAAHPQVTATLSAAPAPAVVIAIDANKAPGLVGSAGNLTAFSTSACPRLNLDGAACATPPTTLVEGHDPTLFAGQEGAGALIDTIYRFPFNYSAPFPKNQATTNDGAFSMFLGGDHEQWGLAVKDLTTPASRNLRDLVFYFPDATVGTDRLRAARFIDNGPSTAIFAVPAGGGRIPCSDCIRDTNDPATPAMTFNNLWDAVLEPKATVSPMVAPNGCLLVSDDGNGSIYSVDTRDPLATNPLVSLVATGLPGPRGLDFGPTGDLFVALQGGNAVIRLSPSPDPTDCF